MSNEYRNKLNRCLWALLNDIARQIKGKTFDGYDSFISSTEWKKTLALEFHQNESSSIMTDEQLSTFVTFVHNRGCELKVRWSKDVPAEYSEWCKQ